ncbi:hypothetical protein TNCV_4134841 [Trichonephila clavipes]|nr:hypothetical protein TNCV_4134841 [Trichonephila clavipes]
MPNVCAWFTNRTLFCIAYPKYCISWQTSDIDTVLGVPDVRNSASMNRTLKFAQSLGQRPTDLISGCVVRTHTTAPCDSPPGGTTAYQLLHCSINHQVANRVTKNDANLALSPQFR